MQSLLQTLGFVMSFDITLSCPFHWPSSSKEVHADDLGMFQGSVLGYTCYIASAGWEVMVKGSGALAFLYSIWDMILMSWIDAR